MDSLKIGSVSFALALHNCHLRDKNNIFLSPYSVYTSLCMVLNGAAESTQIQLRKALNIGSEIPIDQLCKANLKLMDEINNARESITLEVANNVFPDTSFTLCDEFIEACKKYFQCDVIGLHFQSNAADARNTINQWVAERTRDKIKDLLSLGDLQGAKLVLVNAVYFKGDWLNQFDSAKTEAGRFQINLFRSASVQMMKTFSYQRYLKDKTFGVKLLEIPYSGDTVSMIIILPISKFGLNSVMEKMTGTKLLDLVSRIDSFKVKVAVPKFKLEEKYELKNALHRLGIKDMFTTNADLSRISPGSDLFVSQVVHQSYIEVNEEGSEAAAATAVIGLAKGFGFGRPSKPRTFICDHPFFFMIYHKPSQAILFCGSYRNPPKV